jgi:phage terminase small subunit
MARSKPSLHRGRVAERPPSVTKTIGTTPRSPTPPPLKQDFPPPHLRPETASWWKLVVAEFDLEPHHLRILRLACEAWDRGQEAREAIAQHGSVFVDRFDQPRARPEVAIERDCRISFARLMRELALDVEGPDEVSRPPRISGNAARHAAEIELDEEDRRILGLPPLGSSPCP